MSRICCITNLNCYCVIESFYFLLFTDLQTKHFYFIHADCKATVECAVLRFSLDKGVEDVYHKITENDLSGIYEELVTFTNQSSCDNPLFTMMNEDEFADNVRNVYKFLQGVWIAAGVIIVHFL